MIWDWIGKTQAYLRPNLYWDEDYFCDHGRLTKNRFDRHLGFWERAKKDP